MTALFGLRGKAGRDSASVTQASHSQHGEPQPSASAQGCRTSIRCARALPAAAARFLSALQHGWLEPDCRGTYIEPLTRSSGWAAPTYTNRGVSARRSVGRSAQAVDADWPIKQ